MFGDFNSASGSGNKGGSGSGSGATNPLDLFDAMGPTPTGKNIKLKDKIKLKKIFLNFFFKS